LDLKIHAQQCATLRAPNHRKALQTLGICEIMRTDAGPFKKRGFVIMSPLL